MHWNNKTQQKPMFAVFSSSSERLWFLMLFSDVIKCNRMYIDFKGQASIYVFAELFAQLCYQLYFMYSSHECAASNKRLANITVFKQAGVTFNIHSHLPKFLLLIQQYK